MGQQNWLSYKQTYNCLSDGQSVLSFQNGVWQKNRLLRSIVLTGSICSNTDVDPLSIAPAQTTLTQLSILFEGTLPTVSIHCAPEMSKIDCIGRIECFWPKFVRGW